MCTCPIPITREWKYRSGVRYTEVVPCGKCHECLSKIQNEFAALAVLEARKSKSMHFVTFTYSNNTCPVMRTDVSVPLDDNGLVQSFVTSSERLDCVPSMVRERLDRRGRLIKYLVPFDRDNISFVPSLCREDVKLFLKKTRQAYFRKYGDHLQFRYAGFGEYG